MSSDSCACCPGLAVLYICHSCLNVTVSDLLTLQFTLMNYRITGQFSVTSVLRLLLLQSNISKFDSITCWQWIVARWWLTFPLTSHHHQHHHQHYHFPQIDMNLAGQFQQPVPVRVSLSYGDTSSPGRSVLSPFLSFSLAPTLILTHNLASPFSLSLCPSAPTPLSCHNKVPHALVPTSRSKWMPIFLPNGGRLFWIHTYRGGFLIGVLLHVNELYFTFRPCRSI